MIEHIQADAFHRCNREKNDAQRNHQSYFQQNFQYLMDDTIHHGQQSEQ